jgi:hypothetical protein
MVALDKKKLKREIQRAQREKFKVRLDELRELIKGARAAKRQAVAAVRTDCARARVEARLSCQARAEQAKHAGAVVITERQRELNEERGFERKMQKHEKPSRLRATAGERRAESDDEVRSNLHATMVPVFDHVRRHIKASPRMSRTEAFLHWAEENPDEVIELMQHDADRYLNQLLAEQARVERQSRGAAVPF